MQTIDIFGTIGQAVTADSVRAQLEAAGANPVLVRINSNGGDVSEGLAIYELLLRHRGPVTVDIFWALSIASVIAMAGRRVRIAQTGVMMLHKPWTSATGNANDMRRTAEVLDTVEGPLVKAYKRSGKSDAQIAAWLAAETWFDADQALEAGLVDEITTESADITAGAQACAFHIPDHIKARITAMPSPLHTTPPSQTPATPPDLQAQINAAVQAERQRVAEIRAQFQPFLNGERRHTMAALMAACEQDVTCSAAAAGHKILAKLAEGVSPAAGGYVVDIRSDDDKRRRDFQAAATDVLLQRGGVHVAEPHPAARDLQRMSIAALAERCLSMQGVSTSGRSNVDIIQAAMSTSDFPELLKGVTGKSLRAGYENAPNGYARFTGEREVVDFKEQTLAALSEAPDLLKVPELAEYKHGTFAEGAEAFKVETYGRIVRISRQMLVNDDLAAFTRIPQAFGLAARRMEADMVLAKLTANDALKDGVALFHADHGNLAASGGALSVTTLGAARAAMRKQKGLKGEGYLDPQPRFLIVPVALETQAEQLLASLVDPAKNNDTTNPEWMRRLELIADPRLDAASATAWYLAASPAQFDTIVRAYLVGTDRPHVEENSEFERDAISFKVRHDFGTGVMDFRGLYKNPGA